MLTMRRTLLVTLTGLLFCSSLSSVQGLDCIQCLKTEETCTTSPPAATLCTGAETECYIKLDGDNIERGCLQASDPCDVATECSKCTGDNCNIGTLPADRQSCYERDGITQKSCLLPQDTCMGVYDAIGDLQSAGCNEVVKSDCPAPDKYCKACTEDSGTKCSTTFEVLECVQCGLDDDNCALNPPQTGAKCGNPDITQCFVKNVDGRNTRGCLEDESVCTGADCFTCDADNCNNIIYPVGRSKCFSKEGAQSFCLKIDDTCSGVYDSAGALQSAGCNEVVKSDCPAPDKFCKACIEDSGTKCSTTFEVLECVKCGLDDDNCALNPPQTGAKCDNPDITQCYVKNVDGKNERGCLAADDECTTDCKPCTEKNCNTEIYPSTRKQCSNKAGVDGYCLKPDDTCSGVYNNLGVLQESGCAQDIASQCDGVNTYCEACTLSDKSCHPNLDFLHCITCPSSSDACTIDPPTTSTKCATGTTKCFLKNEDGRNTRGCLEDESVCTGADCVICDEENCNNIIYPVGRSKCFSKEGVQSFCLKVDDTCSGVYDSAGDLQSAGCNEVVKTDCPAADKYCKACTEDSGTKCSATFEVLECVKCGLDDDNCALNPPQTGAKCDNPDITRCYVKNVDGKNERGCLGLNEECSSSTNCESCTDNVCNTEIYPAGRTSCYDRNDVKGYCLKVDDKCTGVYDATDALINSGCNEVVKAECDEPQKTCADCTVETNFKCKATLDILECVQCEQTDDNCALNPPQTGTKCSNADTTHCYVKNIDGKNERGCLRPGDECTSATNCDSCSINNCNKNIYPTERTSCYNKNNVKEYCLKVDDTCSGVYDAIGDLQSAGCNEVVKSECPAPDKYCKACTEDSGTKCSATFEVLECVQCSLDDDNCALNPPQTGAKCDNPDITQCYVKNVDGKNERGCLALNAECTSASNCEPCPTNNCNKEIYPASRIKCFDSAGTTSQYCLSPFDVCTGRYNDAGELQEAGCHTTINPKCTEGTVCKTCTENNGQSCAPNLNVLQCVQCEASDSACTLNPPSTGGSCPLESTACYVRLIDGKTERGCLAATDECTTDCKPCTGNNCNTEIYPSTRKQCSNKAGVDGYCLKPDDTCSGLYDRSGVLQESGCAQDIASQCDGVNTYCEACTLSDKACHPNLDFLHCITCPSSSDACTIDPPTTSTKCATGTTKCFLKNEDGRNTRGCLEDESVCTGADCVICDEENCNNIIYPGGRSKCVNKAGVQSYCLKVDDTCSGVYEIYGVLQESGCNDAVKNNCNEETTFCKVCKEADGTTCKAQFDTQKCIKCNGGSDCTIKPETLTAAGCKMTDDGCFSRTNAEGENIRDCYNVEEDTECTLEKGCLTCGEDGCNNQIYPEDRRQCHTCSATAACDGDLTNSEELLGYCKVVNDDCFTKIVGVVSTIRGCRSDLALNECPSGTCVECSADKCNNEFKMKAPVLSCYICNGTNDGCGLQLDKDEIKTSLCPGKVLAGQVEKCYSYKEKVIERGCILSIADNVDYKDCVSQEECNVCTENGCNDDDINASVSLTAAFLLVLVGVVTSMTSH